MSAPKHTPGPWVIVETPDAQVFIIGPALRIAEVDGDWPEPSRSNARLIAAAPDLLEALRGCDDAFAAWQVGVVPGRPEDILALIVKVRAALAKAEDR